MTRSLKRRRCLLLLPFVILVHSAQGFSPSPTRNNRDRLTLHLIPLRTLYPKVDSTTNENSCLNSNFQLRSDPSFELCVVEEDDLPDTARFVVESFGSEAIRLSNDMTSSFEQFILQPTVDLLNGYSGIVAFAEVLAGLRSRIRGRLTKNNMGLRGPYPDEEDATETALVLVLARPVQNDTKKMNKNWRIEIIGSVELRIQPCDAKIPFTLPWLDRLERRLWNKSTKVQQQPYLSNLCVAEAYRGQSIGRALVQCVEEIAGTVWGYSKIYLHVDVDNTAAYQLYTGTGYRDVGQRWNPFWAGSAAEIGYFVKELQ
ncbi:hypothetical protein FisN_12Hh164 [Fistulifera solaris]|uniref:N-acetyltransferase domain-containing protein n=1 Tax=Fistulifera solaris TaxID=1519565 RepID=A0A1Z5KCF6_FISSO|nr:hypothetical protein FisN_12Hh164 [Fistulifera solaris]|eukprot:GAX23598.1 hypothetical protein FisN_12Hh164 [Fistulifera solaris]